MQDLVTVFGGSGFIGTQVVRALAKQGLRVRVAVRQPHIAYNMRLMGDVGQVDVVQANIRNEASVRRALEGAAAAINLVGIGYETGRQKFQAIHVDGACNVAVAARDMGVGRLVQMSALGADAASDSDYARTKREGEEAAREAFPQTVVIRPSIVFGQGDGFFNRFGEIAAMSPVMPMFGDGSTRFQPVFVGDVARAFAQAATDPEVAGQTFELGGPMVYSMREVLALVLRETERKRLVLPVPFFVAGLIGKLCEPLAFFTPVAPPLTADQVKLLQVDNVVSGSLPGLADLGIEATNAESVVSGYLYRFKRGGQFAPLEDVPAPG